MAAKFIVRPPFYATQCEHCGWLGSSEDLREHRYIDDADMSCPKCEEYVAGNDPDPQFLHMFEEVTGEAS